MCGRNNRSKVDDTSVSVFRCIQATMNLDGCSVRFFGATTTGDVSFREKMELWSHCSQASLICGGTRSFQSTFDSQTHCGRILTLTMAGETYLRTSNVWTILETSRHFVTLVRGGKSAVRVRIPFYTKHYVKISTSVMVCFIQESSSSGAMCWSTARSLELHFQWRKPPRERLLSMTCFCIWSRIAYI